MLTTKANSSSAAAEKTTQIKGVCKESLETLMRTAAKIQNNHDDHIGNHAQAAAAANS